MWKILVIDQDVTFTNALAQSICGDDKRLAIVDNAETAISRIKGEQFHLIIIRDNFPHSESFKVLELAMMIDETMPVILILSRSKLDDFREIIRPYTWSILEGRLNMDNLVNTVDNTIDHIKLNHKIRYLIHKQKYIFRFDNIVGVSEKFQNVLSMVKKIAQSDLRQSFF